MAYAPVWIRQVASKYTLVFLLELGTLAKQPKTCSKIA
jgi:hypothetical protein